MNVFRKRINALYANGVEEVRSAGVELLPGDYAWLWDLSNKAVKTGRDVPDILSLPVCLGRIELYPCTLGALLWWKKANEWFEDGPEITLAMAWMLHHPHDKKAFQRAGTRFRARSAVWCWAARLPFKLTIDQLSAGVAVVMGMEEGETLDLPAPGDKGPRPPASVSDYGRFIIRLCARRHLRPDEVKWDISAADASALAQADGDGKVQDARGGSEYLAYRAAIDHLKTRKTPPPPCAPPPEVPE